MNAATTPDLPDLASRALGVACSPPTTSCSPSERT
jgi:hypothetical protein